MHCAPHWKTVCWHDLPRPQSCARTASRRRRRIPTWRAKVSRQLADNPFGRVQLDVSPRIHELHATDKLAVPNSLAFAGIPAVEVGAVDVHRHAAEKFHGMLRDFGERENSRVRDLVDLTILLEHGLLVPERTAAAVKPYGSNATAPNHRTTSRRCQSRGQTATRDLLPATLFTFRPILTPSLMSPAYGSTCSPASNQNSEARRGRSRRIATQRRKPTSPQRRTPNARQSPHRDVKVVR